MEQNKNLKKINLWEIGEEFETLEELLIESGGEITETHEELILHVENLLKTKTDGVVAYIEKQKDLISLADEKIKALQDFKKARKKATESLSGYVIQCMNKLEKKEIKGEFNRIKIRKPVEIVEIEDSSKIPLQFITLVPAVEQVDKAAVKKALKNNELVEGAKLIEGKKSLTITKRVI